jgi:cytochrome P450
MDPQFLADPYPTYRRLREADPIHQSPLGLWVLTRYDDVLAVLRDHRMAKEPMVVAVAARLGINRADIDYSMLHRDPPDHTRLRGLVSQAFTPRVVERMRPRIQAIVDGLIDRAEDTRAMDVIEGLAYPVPVTVICEMLGVPVADHERFKEWTIDLTRGLDAHLTGRNSAELARRNAAARRAMDDYLAALIAERRRIPRGDLISALIAAEEAGDRLTESELLATCVLLPTAGSETTVNLIGNGTLALLQHPGELRRLRGRPDMIGSAVEECLRYDGPVQRLGRTPSEDVTMGGQTIPKGAIVMLFIGAADRDPAHFADPDRFDIGRTDNRHLAFGLGIHFCLGAPLARVEGEIALSTVVRRLPKLALATVAPQFRQGITVRGLEALPVTY